MPERRELAALLGPDCARASFSLEERIVIVHLMLSLCERTELKINVAPAMKNAETAQQPDAVDAHNTCTVPKVPGQLPCFLCQNDPRLHSEHREKVYRKDSLLRHMKRHFTTMEKKGRCECPQPECAKACTAFDQAGLFLHHVASKHDIALLNNDPKDDLWCH